jgi:hypothetical protein
VARAAAGAPNGEAILDAALGGALLPIVRLVLRGGYGSGAFSATAQRVFVAAAREQLAIAGERPTRSAISALTGLTRKAVAARLRAPGRDRQAPTRFTRIDRFVAAWRADPTLRGRPLTLANDQARDSFDRFVRRHGGDVPPRAMERELVRAGLARAIERNRLELCAAEQGIAGRAARRLLAIEQWLALLTDEDDAARPAVRIAQQRLFEFDSPRDLLAAVDRISRRARTLFDARAARSGKRRRAARSGNQLRVGVALSARTGVPPQSR